MFALAQAQFLYITQSKITFCFENRMRYKGPFKADFSETQKLVISSESSLKEEKRILFTMADKARACFPLSSKAHTFSDFLS